LYVPHVGQATCGSFGSLHRSQVTTVGRLAFQFARRERVLEREVFRFGTATAMPFYSSDALGGASAADGA
jgi:hypothetical protein